MWVCYFLYLNDTAITDGLDLLLIALVFGLFVGRLSHLDQSVYETYLYWLQLFSESAMHETIQLAYWFPHTGVQHIFDAVLGPALIWEYLPGMSLEMLAQRLPSSACSDTRRSYSSGDHFSLRMPPLRWLWYLSRHCLPLRPSNLNSCHILFEISLHFLIFSPSKSFLKISSSCIPRGILKGSMAFFQSLLLYFQSTANQ